MKPAFARTFWKRLLSTFLLVCAIVVAQHGAAPVGGAKRTVTVTEGTNLAASVSPDQRTIVVDLQGALWGRRGQAADRSAAGAGAPGLFSQGRCHRVSGISGRNFSHLDDETGRLGIAARSPTATATIANPVFRPTAHKSRSPPTGPSKEVTTSGRSTLQAAS
jgi:hypothetical protein